MSGNVLTDRYLWHDGCSSFTPDKICDIILDTGSFNNKIFFTSIVDEDIIKYNKLVSEEDQIHKKTENGIINKKWSIPPEYIGLDVSKFFYIINSSFVESKEETSKTLYNNRFKEEMEIVKNSEYFTNLFRCAIYIVDNLKKNSYVFGVGRGSSCASYLLFLLGLHRVDPVKYDVDCVDFFKHK